MINRIAIEGIDGSGKTTVAQALAASLEADGIKTAVCSPFRTANELLSRDIYDLWRNDKVYPDAVSALKRAIEVCDQAATADGAEVIIYDRHWMTAMTELFGSQPRMDAWGDTFVPAAYLRTTPYVAMDRLRNDQDKPWSTIQSQTDYAERYEQIATWFAPNVLGIYRNEADVSIDSLVRAIRWDMNIRR